MVSPDRLRKRTRCIGGEAVFGLTIERDVWGGGTRESDLSWVVLSASEHIVQHMVDGQSGGPNLGTVLVDTVQHFNEVHGENLEIKPIHLLNRCGPRGETVILLTRSDIDRDWCRYAFEFAHELVHLVCTTETKRIAWLQGFKGRNHWFEEALADASSLCALRHMAFAWQHRPPYSNWQPFAAEFETYRAKYIIKTDRRLPHGGTLPTWLPATLPTLEHETKLTANSKRVALYLADLFGQESSGWGAIYWLYRGPHGDMPPDGLPFADHLARWHCNVPDQHKPFVVRVAALLGIGL